MLSIIFPANRGRHQMFFFAFRTDCSTIPVHVYEMEIHLSEG